MDSYAAGSWGPPSAEALLLQLSHWLSTRAPLFPAHTLKHMMGLLYEPELTALGRPPQVAARFRDQVAQWSAHQRWREVSEAEAESDRAVPASSEPSSATTSPAPGTGDISTATQVTATELDAHAEGKRKKTRNRWILGAAAGVVLVGLGVVLAVKFRAPPLEVSLPASLEGTRKRSSSL
jgi:hypothetical protein